ncbi:MAG TPA: Mrp/NBP35 family ATP-binding protein [Phycisphaeraceae bacterium]
MALTKDQILDQLKQVRDPELHRDLVTLNRVKHVAYCDGYARIRISPPPQGQEAQQRLTQQVEAAVRALGDQIKQVQVEFEAQPQSAGSPDASAQARKPQAPSQSQSQAQASNPLPDVSHIIAVGAGKGGVGKSTISVNLAIALARSGARVGLLDGDIYGPSIPTMLGLDPGEHPPRTQGNSILPFEVHGLKAMTIGALVEQEKPLIWRGPMAHGAFRQLATQTAWGPLDYLIIDLPPGTGDVPLTMSQLLPLTGAVIVCTPQKVAQDDAKRALRMFQQLQVPVLGVVENMSYFIGDDGKTYDLFGRGGAEKMAHAMGVPFLGGVPISMRLRVNCDAGDPAANFTEDDPLARALESLGQRLVEQVRAAQMEAQPPTLHVH